MAPFLMRLPSFYKNPLYCHWRDSDTSLIEDKPRDLIDEGSRSIEDIGNDLLHLVISSLQASLVYLTYCFLGWIKGVRPAGFD